MRADEIIEMAEKLRGIGWEVEWANTEIECNVRAEIQVHAGFIGYSGGAVLATTRICLIRGNKGGPSDALLRDWHSHLHDALRDMADERGRIGGRHIVTRHEYPSVTTAPTMESQVGSFLPVVAHVQWYKTQTEIQLQEVVL